MIKQTLLNWFSCQFDVHGGKKKLSELRGKFESNRSRDYNKFKDLLIELQDIAHATGYEIICRERWDELTIPVKDHEHCTYLVERGYDLIDKGHLTYATTNTEILMMRDFVAFHNQVGREVKLSFNKERIKLESI